MSELSRGLIPHLHLKQMVEIAIERLTHPADGQA
jgi:hypothetical protein